MEEDQTKRPLLCSRQRQYRTELSYCCGDRNRWPDLGTYLGDKPKRTGGENECEGEGKEGIRDHLHFGLSGYMAGVTINE